MKVVWVTLTKQHDGHHEDGSNCHGLAEIHAGNTQQESDALK